MYLTDLDYFLVSDGSVHLVKGNYHPANHVISLPVYMPDPLGDRYSLEFGRMAKVVAEPNQKLSKTYRYYNHDNEQVMSCVVPRCEIKKIYYPREGFKRFWLTEPKSSRWRILVESLITLGVSRDDIGIFGSVLVGLDKIERRRVKDVDFVIYGAASCQLVKSKISQLRQLTGTKPLSREHIIYQNIKYSRGLIKNRNNFISTLVNKWSSLDYGSHVVSTIRFIHHPNELPDNPLQSKSIGEIELSGKVIEDLGSNFMPRKFKIVSKDKQTINIYSYFWAHQACVKNGDQVRIYGNCREDGSIILTNPNHGMAILNHVAETEN